MKVVIAGTRYKDPINKIAFDDYPLVMSSIDRSGFAVSEVVCGMAIGVDRLGELWGISNDKPVKEMPADWNKHKKAAGPIRNRQMAEYCDAAVIIWDGISPGTRNMIDEMIRVKKPYYVQLTRSTIEDFMQ